jgi:hypothetical protein
VCRLVALLVQVACMHERCDSGSRVCVSRVDSDIIFVIGVTRVVGRPSFYSHSPRSLLRQRKRVIRVSEKAFVLT